MLTGFVCSSEVRSHLIAIGLLVAEIFMFESVNKRTHRRRLDSNPISSTLSLNSGELKRATF